MKKLIIILLVAVLAFVVYAGCSSRSVSTGKHARGQFLSIPIGVILDNPQKYADQEVTVKGTVEGPASLFSLSVYTLSDRTGEITVYSPKSMAPAEGEVLKVTGRVKQLYRFGDHSFCYIKQTTSKD